jgi:hypothetical protein
MAHVRQFGDVMEHRESMFSKLASGLGAALGAAAAAELSTPRQTEEEHESSEETSDSGSVKVDQSKPGTTTIEVDQHSSKSSKSKTVRKRKR